MHKPLILVVEDDTAVRNLITTTLETHDYRFHIAPTGQAAIVEASSHNLISFCLIWACRIWTALR